MMKCLRKNRPNQYDESMMSVLICQTIRTTLLEFHNSVKLDLPQPSLYSQSKLGLEGRLDLASLGSV